MAIILNANMLKTYCFLLCSLAVSTLIFLMFKEGKNFCFTPVFHSWSWKYMYTNFNFHFNLIVYLTSEKLTGF